MTAARLTLTLMVWSAAVVRPAASQDSAIAVIPTDRAVVLIQLGRVNEAIGLLLQRVASDSVDSHAHLALGSAYYLAKRARDAMREWHQAIRLDSTNMLPRTNLASAFIDAGQFDSAIAEDRRVIALDSSDVIAYDDLGAALDGMGSLNEAMAEWKHSVAINPNSVMAWYNLGGAYARQRNWSAAWDALITVMDINEWYANLFEVVDALAHKSSSDLEQRVKVAPSDTMAHYYLAYAFCFRHDWGKALVEIDRAIALDPSRAIFHKAKGMIASRQGHNADATKNFQDCITADSANWACHNLLGWSYNALGEPNRAREALLAAAHLNPNVVGIQENLGLAYLMADQYEESARAGERAIALGSTYGPVRMNLVAAYLKLQRYDLAWWQLRVAEHMGYAPPDRLRALVSLSPEPRW
jgi:tetratricopeptide (TPR) repeat protein